MHGTALLNVLINNSFLSAYEMKGFSKSRRMALSLYYVN